MARLYNADTNQWESNETYFANREAWESAGMTGGMTGTGLRELAERGILGKDASGSIVRGSESLSVGGGGGAAAQNIAIATQPTVSPVQSVPRPGVTQTQQEQKQAPTPAKRQNKATPTNVVIPAIDAVGTMPGWLDFSVGFGPAVPQAAGSVNNNKGQEQLPSGFNYTPRGTVNTTSSNPIQVVAAPQTREVPSPRARPADMTQEESRGAQGVTIDEKVSGRTSYVERKPTSVNTTSQNKTSGGLNIRSVATQTINAQPVVESRRGSNALTAQNLSWEPAESVRPSVTTPVRERELLPPLPRSTLWTAVLQDAPPAQRVPASYVSRQETIPDIGQPGAPTQSSLMTAAGIKYAPTPQTMSAGIAMTREYNNQVQQEEAASDNPKEFLDLIAKGEGTLEALGFRGYNESYGYGAYTGGDRELTSMTIKEIRDLQREMLADPNNSRNSSALGRYQIVGTTLEGLINSLGLTGEERFDEQMQDMLATELLEQRGLSRYRAGNIDETRFMNNLAQEWASFPRGDGSANYPDQPLGLTQNEARVGLGILRGF